MWEIAYQTQNPTPVLFPAHIGVANSLDGGKNVCNVYLPGGPLKKIRVLGGCWSSGVAEVMLVSGRYCCQIFNLRFEDMTYVLRECARLLDLDEDKVLESATLMHGARAIKDLKEELEGGKIHELTLVMA